MIPIEWVSGDDPTRFLELSFETLPFKSIDQQYDCKYCISLQVFVTYLYMYIYTQMSYLRQKFNQNQDEIGRMCFLVLQTCTKARFAGKILATCWNSITDLARRSCCLQVGGIQNSHGDDWVHSDKWVGLVVGIPEKCKVILVVSALRRGGNPPCKLWHTSLEKPWGRGAT